MLCGQQHRGVIRAAMVCFLFQAEDGIRDHCVTGVQTCALPIQEHTSELQSHSDLVCRLLLGSEEHTSELQSHSDIVCRLLPERNWRSSSAATALRATSACVPSC